MKARLLAVAFAAIVAACGGVAGAGGPPSPTPPPGSVMVTKADHQRTVTAHVGDHIQIALGDDINWQLEPPDGVVLVHPIQNYMLVRGTRSNVLSEDVAHEMVRSLPDGRLMELDAGHNVPLDRPRELADAAVVLAT